MGVATVMLDSKRRPASTQAVSRKVEGIEPRKQVNRKDDGVRMHGSPHRHHRIGEGMFGFLGVGDHGMRDIETARQPGRPCRCFPEMTLKSMPNNRRKGERQKGGRESDRLIVPMKAGNAAGGKETTDGRAE